VIVVSHHTGQYENGDQERAEQQRSPRDPPIVPHQIGGNRNDQRRGDEANTQLPGPEHQIEMILPADLAPDGEDRLDGNQKLDDHQRAQKTIVHVSVR
jgi:hypothetical protein